MHLFPAIGFGARIGGSAPMRCFSLLLLLMLPAGAVLAAGWTSQLQGGGTVTVDPNTNRATVTQGGVTSQLWDGAHRLQDGTILITNRGVAIPNESILESRQIQPPETEEWEGVRIVGTSPCERLVRRVCGDKNQCGEAEACNPSHQLLDMETEERNASKNRGLMSYTSGQCLRALKERGFFASCPKAPVSATQ
jgi:hypothetical protein